ncbi:MAG: (Fe-S)-binding protein [Gemmatimonadales bacterium]
MDASAFASLDPCVHCGFCLPACPTYLATGDEADSPRGRIVLMRALERGEIEPLDTALTQHLDACLGCRGCEPACPSGVGYGQGLAAARTMLTKARGIPAIVRAFLAVMQFPALWRLAFGAGSFLRHIGLAEALAGPSRAGFTMGMLAATEPLEKSALVRALPAHAPTSHAAAPRRPTVALFRGCIMDTVFRHVNEATRRTLEANGFRVLEVPGQVCCGALHEHASDTDGAARLARENVAAFAGRADFIVTNSAGCGAVLKEYGHLLRSEAGAAFGARVRDVSELLADAGPREGAPIPLDVAYDAPCHLQHAQRVHAQPLAVLRAIPELRLHLLPGSDRCCGAAGIYASLHPEMSRAVLADKTRSFTDAPVVPDVVTTGNPGCHMQLGAGLRAAGSDTPVAHPVELLDLSYKRAGLY